MNRYHSVTKNGYTGSTEMVLLEQERGTKMTDKELGELIAAADAKAGKGYGVHYILGAMSVYITDEQWASIVETVNK